jgi:signal transduction histidine kinase
MIQTNFSKAPMVVTVRPYLDSILLNLISNSIKYRSSNRAPLIKISTHIQDEYTVLTISDNGLGINLDLYREKLFTLYSRFHYHVEGKGLGLYLIKTQVTALGGKIEVESEVDNGITFRIYFKTQKSD